MQPNPDYDAYKVIFMKTVIKLNELLSWKTNFSRVEIVISCFPLLKYPHTFLFYKMPFSSSSDSSGSESDYEPEESNGRSPILFKNY